MLLITLYICYYQSKCCFRHFKRKFQNPAHTTPPSNQTVRIVTGNEQPMTWNFSTQEYSSPSQMQPPYYGQQSAFNPGKNRVWPLLIKPLNLTSEVEFDLTWTINEYSASGANFGILNNQYFPQAGSDTSSDISMLTWRTLIRLIKKINFVTLKSAAIIQADYNPLKWLQKNSCVWYKKSDKQKLVCMIWKHRRSRKEILLEISVRRWQNINRNLNLSHMPLDQGGPMVLVLLVFHHSWPLVLEIFVRFLIRP